MKKITISLIAAIGTNRALGKDNKLLWHIPEDMKRFKRLTMRHVIIMGRKTYDSIGKALPNRINIIISRDKKYRASDGILAHSLDEAVHIAKEKEHDEIFIIGGGQIYKQAISCADKLYLTIVNEAPEADVFFPDYSAFNKTILEQKSSYQHLTYTFQDLIK